MLMASTAEERSSRSGSACRPTRFAPFLLYRVLQSHFPANSVMALLMRRSFPSSGLILSLVRKRTVDLSGIVKDASRRAKNDAFHTPPKLSRQWFNLERKKSYEKKK